MTAPDYGIVVPADWWRVDLTAGDREVGGRRAVRRTRHDLPGDLPVDGRPSLVVQYAFVMPEVVVMMSFSTPVLALAEPLTALFDAVAETFRWSEGAA